MVRNLLKSLPISIESIFSDTDLPKSPNKDNSLDNQEDSIDLADIMDEATEHFTYEPEFSERRTSIADEQFEIFSLDGYVPARIFYTVHRPTEIISEPTHAHGQLRLFPENWRDYEDTVRDATLRKERTHLEYVESGQKGKTIAEFYIGPEEIEKIPEIHEEAAETAFDVYSIYVDKLIQELEETEYVEGVIEEDYYNESNEWHLTDEEIRYKEVAENYISEFPNLVTNAEHRAMALTKVLEQNRNQLK